MIPHGNTWGLYSPPGITWDKQLEGSAHDPHRQRLVEIMSGHGNSEEFRAWQEILLDAEARPRCPEPSAAYLPSCWRAGELVFERCRNAGLPDAECTARAADARERHVNMGVVGQLLVRGDQDEIEDFPLHATTSVAQGATRFSPVPEMKMAKSKKSPPEVPQRKGPVPAKESNGGGSGMPEPTHKDIAFRAYELFVARDGGPGNAEEDWFRAELELIGAHPA